jgi:hypothetical protein
MAKTKKQLSDYEKILNEFESDFNDTELQERYDQFEKTVKDFKELYNILVPQINSQIANAKTLSDMIVDSAKMGFLNTQAVNQLKETEASLKEQMDAANTYRERFTKEEELIKKYKENSDNKLFHYWKMFKAINSNTEPWLEWKRPYEKRII